jgi:5-methyltetrahydropteroyltriglutamate--homocysteine methyltransferase
MQVKSYVHGIYPRSEALVAATRDLERGRTAPDAVERQREDDLRQFAALQKQSGIDIYSDGLLWWQDIFRLLVDAADGLEAGALVRWLDNNSFFRAPTVRNQTSLDSSTTTLVRNGMSPLLGTLPSPYLFSRAADAGGDRNSLMLELSEAVLRPATEELVKRGCELIHLEEPWLAYFGIEDTDWDPFNRALQTIRDGLAVQFVLHTYYGDISPWLDRLTELPVDAVGIDFVETDWRSLNGKWSIGLAAGCINGRATVLESPEAALDLLHRVVDALEPAALYVCPSSDLDLLPEASARRKVQLLGEIAAKAKEELS